MAKLWDLCNIHVINLYSRDDRYEHITKELSRAGIENFTIHRFHKHPHSAALGLFENVIHILSENVCVQKPILIFEDDAMFHDSAMPLLENVYDYITSPTKPWDTIRLGYNKVMFTQKLNDHLYIGNSASATANIYSCEFAIRLIDRYKGQVPNRHLDHELARISGRNILPKQSILGQGLLGSDNVWPNASAMKEFLADPIACQQKYNNMGKKYFDSYAYLPSCIKYYWLMCKYHKWYNVIGFNPIIYYETRQLCHI